MTLKFTVLPEENGIVLRDFLRGRRVSSTLLRAVKTAGGYRKNGMPVHTDIRLAEGDCVSFELPPEPPTDVIPQNIPLDIVYEDLHAMVLNKPAGQTVHPTRGYTDGTLANAFCGEMSRRGEYTTVFRPVNRLDRGTSGLVLCAMNAYSASVLAKNVQKVYYALVQGNIPNDSGVIDASIALAHGSIIRRCVCGEGKPSKTGYSVLARSGTHTLVRVIPFTGRTHQIRVHFADYGFPLAGDDMYGGNTEFIIRPALHCGTMTFDSPDQDGPVTVSAPFPSDFKKLLNLCGIHPDSATVPDAKPGSGCKKSENVYN